MSRILAPLLLLALVAGTIAAQEPCFEAGAFLQTVAELPGERPLDWVVASDSWVFALRDADFGTALLRIYSLADPAEPVRVASLDLPEAYWTVGLQVVEDRLYVVMRDGTASSVVVVLDVADPTAPSVLASVPVGDRLESFDVEGTRLAAITQEHVLRLFDLADPDDPVWLGDTVNLPDYGEIWAVDLLPDRAVYSTYYPFGVVVLDLSDPTAPVPILDSPSPNFENLAMAPDAQQGWAGAYGSGLFHVDLAAPQPVFERVGAGGLSIHLHGGLLVTEDGSAPVRVYRDLGDGRVSLRAELHLPGPRVAFAGDHLVSVDDENGLQVRTIDPEATALFAGGEFTWPFDDDGHELAPILETPYLLDLDAAENRVQLLDASDPDVARRRGLRTYDSDPIAAWGRGDVAYVAFDTDELRAFDVSHPANLVDLGPVLELRDVRAFLPEGDDRLWVSSTASDLWLLDLSEPTAPQILMHQWWTGSIRGLARVDHYLILAAYLSGLYILDVSDPLAPTLANQVDGLFAGVMAHHGDRLYVGSNFDDGVTVFSVADPTQPQEIGTIHLSGSARRMTVHEDRLWLVGGPYYGSDLLVYDLLDPDPAPQPALVVDALGRGGLAPLGERMAAGSGYLYLVNPPCRDITGVDEPGGVPAARLQLTAAPNPFNPRTTLSLALPVGGAVHLAVHDLRGRRLRTLLSGEQPAGEMAATWDGRDDRGRALPAGVYLARAVTEAGAAGVKVVLVK